MGLGGGAMEFDAGVMVLYDGAMCLKLWSWSLILGS